MALPAEMFERIGRGHAPYPRANFVGQPERHAFHEPATVRIAHASRIDDAIGRNRGDVDALAARKVHGRTVLTPSDDERLCLREHVGLAEPGFLADQLELVVVADDEVSADDPVFELNA